MPFRFRHERTTGHKTIGCSGCSSMTVSITGCDMTAQQFHRITRTIRTTRTVVKILGGSVTLRRPSMLAPSPQYFEPRRWVPEAFPYYIPPVPHGGYIGRLWWRVFIGGDKARQSDFGAIRYAARKPELLLYSQVIARIPQYARVAHSFTFGIFETCSEHISSYFRYCFKPCIVIHVSPRRIFRKCSDNCGQILAMFFFSCNLTGART